MKIAFQAVINEAIIIEAGTPLIKSEGVRSISILKGVFNRNILLADMKTMDAGSIEAKLAFDNGADIVTVLGVADDSTIKNVVRVAKEYGKLVQADLINHPNPISRAKELVSLEVDIIGLHVGVDVQASRKETALEIKNLVSKVKEAVGKDTYISVAGGIKPENAGIFASAGAEIIVIGSGITKSSNPRDKTLVALKSLGYR